MFEVWSDGLGQVKTRVPRQFGIGVYYPDAASFPSDAERQRATQISIQKGVVRPGTDWRTCASIDEVTGECAAFVSPQPGATAGFVGAQPHPWWVGGPGPRVLPPGIVPAGTTTDRVGGSPATKTKSLQACSYPAPPTGYRYVRGPTYDSATNCGMVLEAIPAESCPRGTRLTGMSSSIPPRPICERIETQPTPQPTPPATVAKPPTVARPQPVPAGEACPPAGYVTRPLPGTKEYGVFPCRPGGAVRIDPARMRALTADAQRRGLSDITEVLAFVQEPRWGLPTWAWVAIAIAVFMIVRKGRR